MDILKEIVDNEEEAAIDMPQDLARKLFEEGAILILVGVPIGTEFGIDLKSYKVGENFRGIKMIPPGPHFVHTAAEGPYGDSALRVGFIHYYKKQEIVIREWDDQNEELRERRSGDINLDIARIRDNMKDVDRFLAPYNYQGLKKWQALTNDITEEIISRSAPTTGIVRPSAEFQSCSDADRPKGNSPLTKELVVKSRQTEDDLLPNLKIVPGTAPRFTKIPALCPLTASPAEISQCHLDSIKAIDSYFSRFPNPNEIIQEIQLSFILYLSGCSVDALAHWRKILGLLANSETAVQKYRILYRRYLDVLEHQIPDLPEELMLPTSNNTVYKDVGRLIRNSTMAGLTRETDALRVALGSKMLWNFDDFFEEDPEDQPVVVEL